MPEFKFSRFFIIVIVGTMALAPIASGCSSQHAAPVEPDRARQALNTALNSWKEEANVASLRSGSPAIIVQDMDWEAGMRLVNFQILGDGKEEDANLRCPVQLVLRDGQGRQWNRKVHYIVGTSPVVTVFREVMR